MAFSPQKDPRPGLGKTEKDSAGFFKEQVANPMTLKTVADFFCLAIFKCAHTQANPVDFPHTTDDSPPLSRMLENARHRVPACKYG